MTTPSSPVSVYDVNIELGTPGTSNANLNQTSFRNFSGNTSGAVYMSNMSNRTNLYWADTGSTYHPDIAVYGGTYGTGDGYWYVTTDGIVGLEVPTDAGGASFGTYYLLSRGPSSGYTIRVYNANGTVLAPDGSYVPIGSWSGYFYITSQRNFNMASDTSGTTEIQNQYTGAAIYINWYMHIDYYA